jgi:dTMP kinase
VIVTPSAPPDTLTTPPGKFVVLEGIDGAGKSTHLDFICGLLERHVGRAVVRTREPGGTPAGEAIRRILLGELEPGNTDIDGITETLLAFASRRAHVQSLIRPALNAGQWVVSDRFTDSTRAYQGGGAGVDRVWIDSLAYVVEAGCHPDRVYVFDLSAEDAARRRGGRHAPQDRFESRDCEYFERVRAVYADQAQRHPDRYRIIDSRLSLEEIRKVLEQDILSI